MSTWKANINFKRGTSLVMWDEYVFRLQLRAGRLLILPASIKIVQQE